MPMVPDLSSHEVEVIKVMKLNNTVSHYLSPHGKFGRKPFIACDECFGSISGLAQLGFCWWAFFVLRK